MAELHHLFILSTPTQTVITEGPPDSDLEVPPYSLIEVAPNSDGTQIKNIQCVYIFGMQDSDSLYRAYDNPTISDMITGDGHCRNLLQKILYCIKDDVDTECESPQQLVNGFVAGIATTMLAYCMAKYDPSDVGDPYYPIEIILPDEARASESEVDLLTESMYDHYNQGAKIVLFSGMASIGSQWAKEIISFWDTWGHCFDAGHSYDCSESIYRATSSCLQYLISSDNHHAVRSNMAKCMENHASTQIARICEAKNKFGGSVDSMIEEHCNKLQNMYVEMATELEDIKSSAYEDVTHQSSAAMDMIEHGSHAAKDKLIKDQEAVVAKMKSQLASYTENLKADLKETIRKIVETKVKSYITDSVSRIDTSDMYSRRLSRLEERLKNLESGQC